MENWSILLVEDDHHGQRVLRALLEHHHIQVDVAQNAEQALTFLDQATYTAAILDLALPGMTGWDLLQTIQNHPLAANTPCVAVTAFHSARVARDTIDAGFRAYFPKPIDVGSFVDDLKHYLYE